MWYAHGFLCWECHSSLSMCDFGVRVFWLISLLSNSTRFISSSSKCEQNSNLLLGSCVCFLFHRMHVMMCTSGCLEIRNQIYQNVIWKINRSLIIRLHCDELLVDKIKCINNGIIKCTNPFDYHWDSIKMASACLEERLFQFDQVSSFDRRTYHPIFNCLRYFANVIKCILFIWGPVVVLYSCGTIIKQPKSRRKLQIA